MSGRSSIKITNGALDETPRGEIVLRGVVAPDSLAALRADEYQREILAAAKIDALMKALTNNGVPDIELGMRGDRVTETNGAFYLKDPVYVIDGLQRVTAAKRLLDELEDVVPHLGATIHFGTTEDTERAMFERFNLGQTKLSANVLLRNQRAINPAADALFRLSENKAFILQGKICWDQYMKRDHRLTAITFIKVVAMLHSHAGPGRSNSSMELVDGLLKIMENVGRQTLLNNVRAFFDLIDQCWGINRVSYRHGAAYLYSGFMIQLAKVVSDHLNFWKEDRLQVERSIVTKLSGFNVSDPYIMQLASSGGSAGAILYGEFVDHINSGKRTRRLQSRRVLHDTVSSEPANGNDPDGEIEAS